MFVLEKAWLLHKRYVFETCSQHKLPTGLGHFGTRRSVPVQATAGYLGAIFTD